MNSPWPTLACFPCSASFFTNIMLIYSSVGVNREAYVGSSLIFWIGTIQ